MGNGGGGGGGRVGAGPKEREEDIVCYRKKVRESIEVSLGAFMSLIYNYCFLDCVWA